MEMVCCAVAAYCGRVCGGRKYVERKYVERKYVEREYGDGTRGLYDGLASCHVLC